MRFFGGSFRRGFRFNYELATTDPITALALDPKHVDWLSPDGSLHMCYNLSTLRSVAAVAGKWMQPPHFRTVMEPQLAAQIRERFRIEHLDPAVYVQDDGSGGGGGGGRGGGGRGGGVRYAEHHRRLLETCSQQWMKGDFFVCPVCYHWLELRALGRNNDDFLEDPE